MSPSWDSCPICRWVIQDAVHRAPGWTCEFRGVCLDTSNNENNFVLTGVGRYEDAGERKFIAPRNPKHRYDDLNYTRSNADEFAAMFRDEEINNRRGYAIHEECWRLIVRVMDPEPVNIERLFRVLDSLPTFGCDILDWGQRYSGDDTMFYPWELRPGSGNHELAPTADRPISTRVDLSRLLSHTFIDESQEILGEDFELFKAFDCRSEFGWFFEFQEEKHRRNRNWNRLYQCVQERTNLISGQDWVVLNARKSIWTHVTGNIIPLLNLHDVHIRKPQAAWPGPAASLSEQSWVKVEGIWDEQVCSWRPQPPRDLRIYSFVLPKPEEMTSLQVFTVKVEGKTYVGGLKLSATNSRDITLGYTGNERQWEKPVAIDGGLSGFNVAIGPNGIHALQNLNAKGYPGEWTGGPHQDVAKTARLGFSRSMQALKLEFDGFKLVNISSIPGPSPRLSITDDTGDIITAPENNTDMTFIPRTLRDAAVWYPDIPPPHMSLNTSKFPQFNSYIIDFNPLFWTHFSGPQGSYLRNLTKIISDSDRVITFEYDTSVIPMECKSFGRAPPYKDESDEEPEEDSDSDSDKEQEKTTTKEKFDPYITFAIDGPGGERISTVDITQKYYPESRGWFKTDGVLAEFSISTDRGRTCRFPMDECIDRGWVTRTAKFEVPHGAVLTGFYGSQYPSVGCGLATLGFVTEVVDAEGKVQLGSQNDN
ncbi:hypothetical protein QBC41DRAFT_238001 [Cercophora samala]|uniref:DUF7600 domain-containing protein n=1 Tax=Cercophora samala TaxID=330535 RepID=A0AA39YTH0_9PEZI|nr:hypothetical protein QBC41DRAFT_238001 [Cercophora samala]